MSTDPRLSELLARWQESREQGRALAAEDLCRDCPDLLDALKRRIQDRQALTPVPSCPTTPWTTPHPTDPILDDPVELPALADYEIARELGRGGMGIVYQAFDPRRQRMVALKTLQKLNPAALYRFKQEFRALADVTHPNLVPLYELISDGRTWFFTMELLQGVDFLAYVRAEDRAFHEEGTKNLSSDPREEPASQPDGAAAPAGLTPLQIARLREVLRQLAEGVAALHAAGKLHRDLKPSNVLVTPAGQLVVLDFGLTANLEGPGVYPNAEEHVVGTAAYMAPEQAMGRPLSPASDWYSVGVMLYEVLTGRRPFAGRRLQVLMDKQMLDPPTPATLVPGLPEDLNALCVALLRRAPEERPAGQEVLRRLSGAAPRLEPVVPSWSAVVTRAPFVGRVQQLAALQDAFQTTRQGRAVVLLVRGRSGLGKSALVQSFLDRLRQRGDVVVLTGRCYEQESMPYKALDSLVDALGLYLERLPRPEAEALLPRDILALARVFPVLRRVEAVAEAPRHSSETPDQQELRRRAFTALRELLARLGEQRPLVLAIDDLQWGDLDSALLLSEVLRPPDPPVLLLLGSYRSEAAEAGAFLRTIFELAAKPPAALDWRQVAVDVLTPVEAEELALSLLGQDNPVLQAHAGTIARESGGNPLFVSALVQHLRAGAELAEQAGNLALDRVLWARLLELPGAARRLLEVLAVAGQPLQQADACRAAALGAEEPAVLHHLRTAHLLRGSGPRIEDDIEIFHDRIREIITAHLAPAALKDHHGRLAVTLEASGHADPETLAIHFQGSENLGQAGRYYGLAAEKAAQTLAFDRAAKLYRLAVELRPAEGAAQRDLRVKLADALANAGRGAEAAREYQAAARDASASQVLDLQRRAAYHYCISGRLEEGKAAFGAVLGRVGMRLPRTPGRALLALLLGRARLWLRGIRFHERDAGQVAEEDLNRIDVAWSASAGLSMFDVIAGADFQTRNLLLALRAGEPYRLARALAWQAAHTSNLGCAAWPRTAKLLDAAQSLVQRINHPYALGITTLSAGVAEFTTGRWRNARTCLERAEGILRDRCTGVAWELDTAHTFTLWSLFYLGELAEMSRRSARLLKEAQQRGDLYAVTTLGTFTEAIARLAANEPADARRVVDEFLQQWSQRGFQVQHMIALMSHTYIDLYCGNGAAAWQRINAQWPAVQGSHLLVVQVIRSLLTNLRARSALAAAQVAAHPGPLLRAAERDARRLERERTPYSGPLARLLRAGVAALRGDRTGAATRFAEAAAGLDAADMRLFAAAARHRQGQLLGGPEGMVLASAAVAGMIEQKVQDPARLVAALAPTIGDRSSQP